MTALTLTEKVYGVLAADHGFGVSDLFHAVARYPRHGDNGLTNFEMDCRGWGLAFGIAYGIARGEDPFEPEESVSARAMTAARDAFARWGDGDIFTLEAYAADRADRQKVEAVA